MAWRTKDRQSRWMSEACNEQEEEEVEVKHTRSMQDLKHGGALP